MKQAYVATFMDYFPRPVNLWIYDRELMKKSGRPEFKGFIDSLLPNDRIGML